jgi:formyl-CoA transferase
MMSTYLTHEPAKRAGNRLGAGPVGDIFKCAPGGPNDFVYLYCANQEMWQSLFKTIGRPEVAVDPRFTDRKEARKHAEELTQIIEEWTSKRTKQEVMRIISEANVPCGAVFDSVELLNDPHLKEVLPL